MTWTRLVARDGRTVCERCLVADRLLARMRGLLGRSELPRDEGVLLRPAPSVHTFLMRFPIDVVFLDRRFEVVGIRGSVAPWRVAWCRGAHMALELAACEAARRGIRVGERLALDASPKPSALRRGRGISVVLAAADRPFLNVASFLLDRAGFDVAPTSDQMSVCDVVERHRAHVVVLDATGTAGDAAESVAELSVRHPEVGVVVVSDAPTSATLHALPKWGAFEDLREQIELVAAP